MDLRRTLLVVVGSLLLGFSGLYLVARQELFDLTAFTAVDWKPWIVIMIVVSMLGSYGAPSWRLTIMSRAQGSKLTPIRGLYVHLATMFGAALTPGNTGGAPVTAIALNRLGIPLGQGISIAVQAIVVDLVFFAWSVPLSLLYLLAFERLHLTASIQIVIVLLTALFVLLAVLLGLYPRLMLRALLWLAGQRVFGRIRRRMRKASRDYYRSALRFRVLPPKVWVYLHGLTALGWLSTFTLFWVLLALFNNQIQLLDSVAILDLIILVGNVVPTPGGSGFMEAVVGIGTKTQKGAEYVAAPLLMWRFLSFYIAFILGPVATGLLLGTKSERGGASIQRFSQ